MFRASRRARHVDKPEGLAPGGRRVCTRAMQMIFVRAEKRGPSSRGRARRSDQPATRGSRSAMAARSAEYRMILIMPEHLSAERRQTMRAFRPRSSHAKSGAWEAGADLAENMQREGRTHPRPVRQSRQPAVALRRHGTGDMARTRARFTHFVSSMAPPAHHGCSRFFRRRTQDPDRRLPARGGLADPGHPQVGRGPTAQVYDKTRVDRLEYVSQADAEDMARRWRARRVSSPASPPGARSRSL